MHFQWNRKYFNKRKLHQNGYEIGMAKQMCQSIRITDSYLFYYIWIANGFLDFVFGIGNRWRERERTEKKDAIEILVHVIKYDVKSIPDAFMCCRSHG